MSFLRVQVTNPSDTGDPADTVSNTWHFDSDAAYDATVLAGIVTKLTAFYQAVAGDMPSQLLGPTWTAKVYNLADPEPRVPLDTFTIAVTMGAGTPLPSEVALVLAFRGATESGANMRRRRGRVYIGPLLQSAATVSGGRVLVDPGAVTRLKNAAIALRDLVTTSNAKWAVYSPTTHREGGTLDASFEDVVAGFVDNALDTQRRRGTQPTIRTTW